MDQEMEERKPPLEGVDNAAYVNSGTDAVTLSDLGQKAPSQDDQTTAVVVRQGQAETSTPYEPYGCCSFTPRWLQCLANIKVYLLLVVLLCMCEGFAVNGVTSAALFHLEKQFGLTSTRSALINSSQDIGALVVVLFVSYAGARYSKPHWVAVGSLIMALGSFLFIVPHLATRATVEAGGPPPSGVCEPTPAGNSNNNLTISNTTSPSPTDSSSSSSSNLMHYLGLFMVANIIHGIGFTPMFTLGTVYLDENEEHSLAAVYVGMTYAATALGVALGFFVSGQFTEKYYVDFDTLDQSKLTFGPRDPQWVGAWWVGYIPSCILFVLLALPIYGFPRALPSGEDKQDAVTNGKVKSKDGDKSVCKEIFLPFFGAVKKLVINPPFMCLCVASAAETLLISGVTAFAFKYLLEQFSMTFAEAGNILSGLIVLGATGMLGGGILIRLFRLNAPGMCVMNGILDLVAVGLGFAILASCPEVRLAGLEIPYPRDVSVTNYSSSCQGSCQCQAMAFDPVCGGDNRVYFSPCHAGCLTMNNPGPLATYHNCSCVARALNVSEMSDDAMASRGRCPVSCDERNIFLPCMFLMFFAVLLTTTPNSMACLRIVDQDQRPFAMGLQWMLIRLLGTIPGPPLVGYVMDKTCLVWSQSPDGSQFCAMYSKTDMALGVFIWWICTNAVASFFHFLSAILLKCRRHQSVDLQ